ncbi:MAG: VanZ family protein [Pseudomonadota bacterium]
MPYRTYWLGLGWGLILAVTYLSLTASPIDTGVDNGDKAGHLLAYFSLMAWWGQLDRRVNALLILFLAMGAGLELLQGLIPGREPSLLDMAANAGGALLGWLATRAWPSWLPAAAAGRP